MNELTRGWRKNCDEGRHTF